MHVFISLHFHSTTTVRPTTTFLSPPPALPVGRQAEVECSSRGSQPAALITWTKLTQDGASTQLPAEVSPCRKALFFLIKENEVGEVQCTVASIVTFCLVRPFINLFQSCYTYGLNLKSFEDAVNPFNFFL